MILTVFFFGCGGQLSDEQRKNMKEQMELHKIKKVTDSEITEAAFAKGRAIIAALETFHGDSAKIDSMVKAEKGRLRWIVPGSSNALAMEQQLIDAYLQADVTEQVDNVQQIRNSEGESDSLLYTKPSLSKLPDGTEKLEGVWNVWLSKKELVLSMDNK